MTEYKTNQTKLDQIKGLIRPNLQKDFSWPESPEFKEFLNKIKHNIRWIKFTGGEPSINPYIVDFLNNIPAPELVTMFFVTNGTKINQDLLDATAKFGEAYICGSIEGIGDDNDQLRYLSKWNEVEKNMLAFKALPNVRFIIHYIFQCFSVKTLIPVLEWCDSHDMRIENLTLIKPPQLHINSVDPETIAKFKDKLINTNVSLRNEHVKKQMLAFLDDYKFDPELKKDRQNYLETLDSIRGSHLTKIIENDYE